MKQSEEFKGGKHMQRIIQTIICVNNYIDRKQCIENNLQKSNLI
jgi:hypothetical protein